LVMTIWALADLHLAFGDPDKDMALFGGPWVGYAEKIERHWREAVGEDDLVLIPGDISWAKNLATAMVDLEWIDKLPGTKVMCKGNHDYWWQSINRLREQLPPSMHALQADLFEWGEVAIVGTRLWDDPELNFDNYIIETPNPRVKAAFYPSEEEQKASEKIFVRELGRLERALQQMPDSARTRIAMVHYPPIGPQLRPSRASKLLEQYNVDICTFGHLHSVRTEMEMFGTKNGVRYLFTAGDAIDFKPVKVL